MTPAPLVGIAVVGLVGLFAEMLPEPYNTLAQYGLAGFLGFLLLRRYDAELAREQARADAAEAKRDQLVEHNTAETIPLLGEVQRTMVPTMNKLVDTIERMSSRIDQLSDRIAALERRPPDRGR